MNVLETASDAIDRRWEVQLGGRTMPTKSRYDIEDPTTGRRVTDAPDCSAVEVDQIVRAAAEAQRARTDISRMACGRRWAVCLGAFPGESAMSAIDMYSSLRTHR